MKKLTRLTLLMALSLCAFAPAVRAGDTSLTGYATYWEGQDDSGVGGGLRLKRTFLGFGAAELRGGYVRFDNGNESSEPSVIPLEVAANVRLPFFISPYLGVGAGYYFTSDVPDINDGAGYFVQAGVEFTLFVVGAMAEVRWQEIDGDYLDGMSANLGILIKW
jgi:opacity protein-like surface antigen